MTQTTLREYLRTTEDAISSGRIEEAMTNCQNILTYFPEALEAQRLLGEVYLAQGQLEEAKQTFEWLLTNDPENVIVYCDRALISERSSDIDTALDCYQQAYELSRGNANIRQEFNQLSARAGQQEFMFSRAGLARLYMRGDLLTQAIQEWDAVLSISPDRLDARLGLMETYWREGMYEKAEAIATQLLEEIPTCLKALLYLAHITSISNIQRAREFLQRAEALDPELTMAQETFADLAARQPGDPFLQLLKREPILLEEGRPLNFAASAQPAPTPVAPTPTPAAPTPQVPASPYDNWETQGNWNTPAQPTSSPAISPIPETPTRIGWNEEAPVLASHSQAAPEIPSWQEQMEMSLPPALEEQPWYQNDALVQADTQLTPDWHQSQSGANWNNEPQEEEEIAPPAWLDTLTKNEQQQHIAESPIKAASAPLPVVPPPVTPSARPTPQPQSPVADEPMPFFMPAEEASENEMGWPEWLKSLGAESLEQEPATPSEPLPDIDATPIKQNANTPTWDTPQPVETKSQPAADPWAALPVMSAQNDTWTEPTSQPEWMQQMSPSPLANSPLPTPSTAPDWVQQMSPAQNPAAQSAAPDWMQQMSPTPNPTSNGTADWMQQMSPTPNPTSNGTPDWVQQFSPVSDAAAQNQNGMPEWMQSFGAQPTPTPDTSASVSEQEQHYITSLEDLEKSLQAQGFTQMTPGSLASIAQAQQNVPTPPTTPVQPQPQETSRSSSALEQLGHISQAPLSPTKDEPWWNSTPQQAPAQPTPVQQRATEPINDPFAALGARTTEPFAPLPATPTPMQQGQQFAPAASQNAQSQPDAQLLPVYRSDALLDDELETTMKRPAITLQPIQAGTAQGDRPYVSKGRNERKHEHADDGNLNSHDRLVKGYQYQLSGAYDDAMQEYRTIIRNAPELLDDVISNLRALLKINPNFSLGYRVLGDAYMRKGEYLQAMESYNKALTMAKKAKG